jgi:hemerythrin superfamily protein
MDVLHVIKSDHDLIKKVFSSLETADGVKTRRLAFDELTKAVQVHLSLGKDYLYPEINGLFPGSEALVESAMTQGSAISKKLKALQKLTTAPASEQTGYGKRVAELKESVLAHLLAEENQVLPKMRDLIPTQDREDLGEVFSDVLVEIRGKLSGSSSPTPTGPAGRKRA